MNHTHDDISAVSMMKCQIFLAHLDKIHFLKTVLQSRNPYEASQHAERCKESQSHPEVENGARSRQVWFWGWCQWRGISWKSRLVANQSLGDENCIAGSMVCMVSHWCLCCGCGCHLTYRSITLLLRVFIRSWKRVIRHMHEPWVNWFSVQCRMSLNKGHNLKRKIPVEKGHW